MRGVRFAAPVCMDIRGVGGGDTASAATRHHRRASVIIGAGILVTRWTGRATRKLIALLIGSVGRSVGRSDELVPAENATAAPGPSPRGTAREKEREREVKQKETK